MRILFIIATIFVVSSTAHFFFTNNHKDEIPKECPITVGTSNERCLKERITDIVKARFWYKITNQNSSINFPLAKIVPWLEQNTTSIKYFYALDPFESRYLVLLNTFVQIISGTISPILKAHFSKLPFVTSQEYAALNIAFNKAIKSLKAPQYFDDPSMHPTYTDHVTNEYWETDDAFTQRRLAGQCPYLLKKVTQQGSKGYKVNELKPLINQQFFKDFKMDVGDGESLTVNQAIHTGRLFVLHLPEMTNVVTMPDLMDKNMTDNYELAKMRSPIGFFVLRNDGNLRITAIQRDPVSDSVVYTTLSDSQDWLLAKGELEQTANTFCQAKLHLGGVHWVSTVYCLSFRRHLSTQHPLYDFFKYHCEGTVPHITLAWSSLALPGSSGHLLFTLGHEGFIKLSTDEYNERNYEKLTYSKLIEGRGLDDDRIKYYPFRDDAKIVLKEFKVFVNKIVDTYYNQGFWFRRRSQIQNDKELQSWVNELSIDGAKKPNGGKGKMIGFPSTFKRTEQLKTFMVRFLWNILFHASVNYALIPDFVPISPTKLYEYTDGAKISFMKAVPDADHSLGMTMFSGLLSTFRINRIFGYWPQLTNPVLRRIVRTAYFRMQNNVQKKLEKRNAERKRKNQLGYQPIEPKWLTNSIHI